MKDKVSTFILLFKNLICVYSVLGHQMSECFYGKAL